jgi:amino acid transporter
MSKNHKLNIHLPKTFRMIDDKGANKLQAKTDASNPKGTLGTFAGVFTPSILTILGIILFLRLGYVVGNAGLSFTLVILLLANGISVLTSVSLSAIATNLKVKSGGDYYLISRTLGHEFGGAIGIVVFLAQSVSIAFYCLGFGEAVSPLLSTDLSFLPQLIAALAVTFLFIFAWLGADWSTRFQYVVMAVLAAAILSFFVGGFLRWDNTLLAQNWSVPQTRLGFWVLFAIFFPAVTGFTQGVSMSGDLKDPGKSLPMGTFLAVGVSIIVYFLAAMVFAAALPADVLKIDYGAMKRVAFFGYLITAGVIAATLSSAMASFLGAPRILQSLAADRIFPFLLPFAKGSGPTANPRRGVILSAGIAYATVAWGQINLIAPVVSMFFLISYGLLNYATFYEARAQSPSFRPRFRYFNKWFSLAGAMACLLVMLAIDIAAGVIAVAVLFGLFQYLRRTARPSRWADSRRSHHLQLIREHLLAAAAEPEHARDWRPQILAFSDNPQRRSQLLRFSSWLEGGSGLTTAVQILEGKGLKMYQLKAEAETQLRRDIQKDEVHAFPLVVTAPNLEIGIQVVVQAYGIGSLKANTILLNWLGRSPAKILGLHDREFGKNLHAAYLHGCNIVILDVKTDKWTALEAPENQGRCIDVWWWGDATSRLMLLMAYLMQRNEKWSETKIRLLVVTDGKGADQTIESLKQMLEEVRIEAEPELVRDVDSDTLAEYSADSAFVFLPFRLRGRQISDPFGNSMENTLFLLPVTALVLAAEDVDLDAEPEEGEAGEIAETLDTLEDSLKKARAADKDAAEAVEAAEKARDKAAEIALGPEGIDAETKVKAEKAAREADKQAVKMTRKAAKAAAKAEAAARQAEASGALPEDSEKD